MQAEQRRMIDVREYPEFAAGHIEGSELVPLGSLEATSEHWDREGPLTLVCRSGRRSEQARALLAGKGFTNLEILRGGIETCEFSGVALVRLPRRPWSMERQVRAIAGVMILISLALAQIVSPWFLVWTTGVGAGLTFAGVTDVCLMATVLGKLPWNRRKQVGA